MSSWIEMRTLTLYVDDGDQSHVLHHIVDPKLWEKYGHYIAKSMDRKMYEHIGWLPKDRRWRVWPFYGA